MELKEEDDGGVVKCVLLLRKLAGWTDAMGEKGNGESEDEGEWERGVLPSEGSFTGRCI